MEDQRLGSELDRVSQRFRHYNRVEDRRRASEWEEKDEKESKEKVEEEREEQKGSEDKEKEEDKKKEKKEEKKSEEERKEEERKEEKEEEERSPDAHPLTDDPPSDRLKDAGDESVETMPSETPRTLSETPRTLSEETDNSEKELVQQ